ncbi:MAG: glycosyltransferase family protein [Planctomycetales bacterium]|nr:glycosyltransferase family protein [Planctomycetales bacterium]
MPTANEVLQQGWQFHQSGDLSRAQQLYELVVQQAPNTPNAWCYLGILHFDRKQYDESERCYRRAIELQPEFPIAWSNLGNTLSALERYREGMECCRRALEQRPDYVTAMSNLGAIHVKLGEFGEAAELFRKALEVQPDHTDAHRNLGAALIRHGDIAGAQRHSERAVQVNPRDADAHKNLGILHLLNGNFAEGWPEYEWRFEAGSATLPRLSQPRWRGEPLQGRSVLLVGEQGLGDTIQFARYAKVLKGMGAGEVIVQCQTVLHPLLSGEPGGIGPPGIDRLADLRQTPPLTDVYLPMMSAPGVLKTLSTEDIPADVPYLRAAPERIARWQQRLERAAPGKIRVGVVWQGSQAHEADGQRSFPLEMLDPVRRVPGVRLVSLQKGYGEEQLSELADWSMVKFDDLDADGAFLDSMALMQCLDLVICADTAPVHVAGASGARVWLALSNSPDWRWMLETEASPWYPTLTLFRQRTPGDWRELFERMAARLAEAFSPNSEAPKAVLPASQLCQRVLIPAAPGELFDKLTILAIKRDRLQGEALKNVTVEWDALSAARAEQVPDVPALLSLERQLREVNERLWDIEDEIRVCERNRDFGQRFIELARSVYRQNDQRAQLKREINLLLGSRILEEKSYEDYESGS